jgi:hypothetical protein
MPPLLSSQVRQGDPGGAAEGPPPGVFEEWGARAQIVVDEDPEGVEYRRHKGYELLIDGLRAKGVADSAMKSRADVWGIEVPGTDAWDYQKIYDLARTHQLGDLNADRAAYDAAVAARPGYDQRRATVERGGRWWLDLPGGIVQSFQPEYGPLPALGLPAKTIIGAAAREAAINTLFEGVEIARTADARETLGNPITTEEALLRGGTAALGGALLGGGAKGIEMKAPGAVDAVRSRFEKMVADNWERLPKALRDKWGSAAKVDDAALPDVAEMLIGRDNMSVAEKGAVDLLRRDADMVASNPFRPDGAGTTQHLGSMIEAIERNVAAIRGTARPRPVPAAGGGTAITSGVVRVPGKPGQVGYANDVYQYFRAKGLSDARARGIAAGIHAESRSDHNVRGGYRGRAVGLGQWLGPRREKLLARYGPNPTRRQQLDFMWEELQGGDAGGRAVLAATDERAVLDAYIRKFMRPAPGAETVGDLQRGMQALGRGGEDIRVEDAAPGRVDGVDPEAELTADLARRRGELDVEQLRLDADIARDRGADVDAPDGPLWIDGAESWLDDVEIMSMPELRRDQFPDEASWRVAQAELDADTLGLPAPMVARRDIFAEEREAVAAAQARPDARPAEAGAPGTEKYGRIEVGDGDDDGRLLVYHPNDPAIAPSNIWMEVDDAGVATISIDGIAALAAEQGGRAAGANRFGVPALREAQAQIQRLFPHVREVRGERLTGAGAGRMQSVPMRPPPRDAGGLTIEERASLEFDEPGLAAHGDPVGEGARMDIDDIRHDLQMAMAAEDLSLSLAFAARDGADQSVADVLADIEIEEAALAALRSCL